eukprot:8744473-Karenia_brevis.AAC.1
MGVKNGHEKKADDESNGGEAKAAVHRKKTEAETMGESKGHEEKAEDEIKGGEAKPAGHGKKIETK